LIALPKLVRRYVCLGAGSITPEAISHSLIALTTLEPAIITAIVSDVFSPKKQEGFRSTNEIAVLNHHLLNGKV
jgi:hypothetical protein